MMTRTERERRRPWRGAARLAIASLLIAGTGSAVGCLDRPIAPNDPRTTSTIVERLTQSAVDKIDLLLAIDNSGSMADKQDILVRAIPDLVQGLVDPRCIHLAGTQAPRRADPNTGQCDEGFQREFEPVRDIHIGIISSSLGGHGATSCKPDPNTSLSNNDMGRLIARSGHNAGTNDLETYLDQGFLAWDPEQKLDPNGTPDVADPGDGEADIDGSDTNADLNSTSLVEQLANMVKGTGQSGCGFEAQLESVYRFLVDPEPYLTIEIDDQGRAVPKDVDTTVLEQRKRFLRPSSLLAIIMLTDENDCSIREGGRNYYVANTASSFRMWRPRQECATDPNDPCCLSCNQEHPDECGVDPTCTGPDGNPARLSEDEDPVNSRCWDQKRRFGFDFLYPIERYKKAFTEATIETRGGDLVQNPIFMDLDETDDDSSIRDPALVFFAGIVGVPWQDIARQNAAGEPDLLNGLNADGEPVGGFKNADELSVPPTVMDGGSYANTWELILGDPASHVPPKDPFMVESSAPRSGANPITGDRIVQPGETGSNAINGREYTIPKSNAGDLQYACIFDLPEEQDCETQSQSCDCRLADPSELNDNPLCRPEGNGDPGQPGDRTSIQYKAKAYPGLRELQLIRDLGAQGIVGSVCPKQLDNANAPDFGYRPAIGAIIDRLKTVLGGQCLPRTLTLDSQKKAPCLILEARNTGGKCDCNQAARTPVLPEHSQAEAKVRELDIAKASGWDCVCEIQQLENEQADVCRTDLNDNAQLNGQPVDGWCYIDPSIKVGNPDIVAGCPPTEQRIIRFMGEGKAQQGATLYISCSGE
ncbi:hypothetical protein WMF31_00305 [Sorangium sp. So ce1036]|uniref:hypothetical protein n=1 Tax=Sorangium sp. So ce1036 TaxID=3133328 RepID=UPI003F014622